MKWDVERVYTYIGTWMKNMAKCMSDFRWSRLGVDVVIKLMNLDIREMMEVLLGGEGRR